MGCTSPLPQISDSHENCSFITGAPQISVASWGPGQPFLNHLFKFYLNNEINGKFRGNEDVEGVSYLEVQ